METQTQKLNIFIVDDNKLMDILLKQYLERKFGPNINISVFYDGESCLAKVDKNTNIVILDYFLDSINKYAKNGIEILRSIKRINPKTEVIMLSSSEDKRVATESFREGAAEYIVKNSEAWDRILTIIIQPLRDLMGEIRISQFLVIFLLEFITMGLIVFAIIKLFT